VRWPIIGIILEIYGFVVLFRLVDDIGILLEFYMTTKLIVHLILMLLVAVVFGLLSKCSSTISLLLDGLYSLYVVSFPVKIHYQDSMFVLIYLSEKYVNFIKYRYYNFMRTSNY